MSLDYAKIMLAEWGCWSRDVNQGYPRQWAVAGAGSVRASDPMLHMPTHIALVDAIVRQAEVKPRRVLIVTYTQFGSPLEKAVRLGMSKSGYYRWLDAAHWHVHTELDYAKIEELAEMEIA